MDAKEEFGPMRIQYQPYYQQFIFILVLRKASHPYRPLPRSRWLTMFALPSRGSV